MYKFAKLLIFALIGIKSTIFHGTGYKYYSAITIITKSYTGIKNVFLIMDTFTLTKRFFERNIRNNIFSLQYV